MFRNRRLLLAMAVLIFGSFLAADYAWAGGGRRGGGGNRSRSNRSRRSSKNNKDKKKTDLERYEQMRQAHRLRDAAGDRRAP